MSRCYLIGLKALVKGVEILSRPQVHEFSGQGVAVMALYLYNTSERFHRPSMPPGSVIFVFNGFRWLYCMSGSRGYRQPYLLSIIIV